MFSIISILEGYNEACPDDFCTSFIIYINFFRLILVDESSRNINKHQLQIKQGNRDLDQYILSSKFSFGKNFQRIFGSMN